MDDPNEPLTPKQKEAIRKAKEAEMDSKMRGKVNKDFPTYGDKKPKGMKAGGRVRGCGIAKRGFGMGRKG